MRLHRITYSILLTAILSLSACREEMSDKQVGSNGNDIHFTVVSTGPMTRSEHSSGARQPLHFDGTDSLFICVAQESMSSPATKGRITTTENLGSFKVSSYLTSGDVYFDQAEVNRSDDGYVYSGRYWPNRTLHFFANSHWEDDLVFDIDDNGTCSGSFSYTLPEPDPQTNNDAKAQPDYIFAITPDQSDSKEAVPLDFQHAFSAICFRIGSMESENRTINYISLKNSVSSGFCQFGLDADEVTSFQWSKQSGSETYVQKIDKAVNNGEIINDDDIVFMMVPHTLSDIEMEISFTLHSGTGYEHEFVISKKISEFTEEWLPNTKYVYTLSATEGVEVEISDLVTANVKSDVEIISKGKSPSYIRAAIVGFWVNTDGNIVADWKQTDGEFVWGADWDTHWVKHTDGFYYHLEELEAGEQTYPLFEQYTITTANAIEDAHLELHIATQAVIHYKVEEAWPGCPLVK